MPLRLSRLSNAYWLIALFENSINFPFNCSNCINVIVIDFHYIFIRIQDVFYVFFMDFVLLLLLLLLHL